MIYKLSDLNLAQQTELFAILRVAITHHSNAIEGTSLSYGETEALLTKGVTAANKPLHEQLIISGFANCFDAILRSAFARGAVDLSFIKDLHAILFEPALAACPGFVERPVGAFRTDERRIAGANVKLARPFEIKDRLAELVKTQPKEICQIARFHIEFERIHPFADGNGRIGRLLMAHQFVANDLVPPLIEAAKRADYLRAMDDERALAELLEDACEKSIGLIDLKNQKERGLER